MGLKGNHELQKILLSGNSKNFRETEQKTHKYFSYDVHLSFNFPIFYFLQSSIPMKLPGNLPSKLFLQCNSCELPEASRVPACVPALHSPRQIRGQHGQLAIVVGQGQGAVMPFSLGHCPRTPLGQGNINKHPDNMDACLCDWPIHRMVATGTCQLFWLPTANRWERHVGKAWQEKAPSSSGTEITRGGKVTFTRLWFGSTPERQPLETRTSLDHPAHTPHHFRCATNPWHLAAAGVCRSYSLQLSSQLSRQLKADQEPAGQSSPRPGWKAGSIKPFV